MTMLARTLTAVLTLVLLGAACAGSDTSAETGGSTLPAPASTMPPTTPADTTSPETTAPPVDRRTLAPAVQVAHASDDPEWTTDVYLDESERAALVERFVATVAAFDAAIEAGHGVGVPLDTDPAAIDTIDLDEHLIVTAGYYCMSGNPLVDAGPGSLVVRIDDGVLCDAPQPVSSIFVVPRALVGASFTVTVDSALDLVEGPTIVVEDGLVTDRLAG